MRFADVFAGLGGFHLAMRAHGADCVFACEINEKLRELYEINFGLTPHCDVRSVIPREVPDHDFLCAGFPCQPFSKAGDQQGFRDESRGTVLFSLLKIVKIKRPQYLLLENVAHFVRHDDGKTYDRLKTSLEQFGYGVDHRRFSPHQFGVPQTRDRMYLVGRLGGLGTFEWPSPSDAPPLSVFEVLDKQPNDARKLSEQTVSCINNWQKFVRKFPAKLSLPGWPIWSMEFGATYPFTKYDSIAVLPKKKLRAFRGSFGRSLGSGEREAILSRLPSHARSDGDCFPIWKQRFISLNRRLYREHRRWIDPWLPNVKEFPSSLQKLEWNCGDGERDLWSYLIQFRASGVRIKKPTSAPSLVAMTSTQVPIVGPERRYMTIRECARLQSLDQLKHLPMGNPAVAALGNAVNVTVAKAIVERLLSAE